MNDLYITIMDGDLSKNIFYPRGILKGNIGIFFNKVVASIVKVYDFTFLSKPMKLS